MRVAFLAVVFGAVLSSCSPPAPACGPDTCDGCCDAAGSCQSGMNDSACGSDGASCSACGSGRTCNAGACTTLTSTCEVDTGAIEFGAVAVGSTQERTFTVRNTGAAPRTLSLEFTSDSSNRISVTPSGSVTIAPNSMQTFTITLDTTLEGAATAKLALQRDQACSSDVTISANTLASMLTWEPAAVDFGYASPGATAKRTVTINNLGAEPVSLTNIVINDQAMTTPSTVFTTTASAPLVVPAQGSVMVELSFKPSVLGPRQAQLNFTTPLPNQSQLSIPLRGVGGGPKVQVATTLTVPSSSVRGSSSAVLDVRNVGPNTNDPAGNLHVRYEVRALANTSISEVLVDFPASYDPVVGVAGGSAVGLEVTFTPMTAGTKSIELHILTDDLLNPDVTVIVTMEAIAAAPCTYTVTPSTIDFGNPRRNTTLDWPVTITNTGTTDCNVLDATVTSSTPFSLRDFTSGILAAGASKQFSVRYSQPTMLSGAVVPAATLRVFTNSSTTPTTDVPLNASARSSCILVPSAIDFGSAPVGCRSASFNIPVLNTCSAAVTVGNASLATATGGTNGEFTATASTGASLAAKTGHTFTVDYSPSNVGVDEVFLTFTSTEPIGTIRHVIPLRGAGITGNVTESFTIGPRKIDILFAIDDSPSMIGAQNALATAVASFGMYATASNIDVRFAAASADLVSPALGMLRRTTGNAAFVSNSTPNAGMELSSLVRLGGMGGTSSCLEASSLALSDESRAGSNFVRDDAHLGVICLTDSPDSTTNAVSFELNRLALVRGLQKPDAFTYSVVGPFLPSAPSGCTYDGVNNATHDTAVTRFFGRKEEICSGDVANSAGLALSYLLRRNDLGFTLYRAPDLSSQPTLTINSVVTPPTDNGMTIWSIDAVTGRLTFSPQHVPQQGAQLEVSYAPLCF